MFNILELNPSCFCVFRSTVLAPSHTSVQVRGKNSQVFQAEIFQCPFSVENGVHRTEQFKVLKEKKQIVAAISVVKIDVCIHKNCEMVFCFQLL